MNRVYQTIVLGVSLTMAHHAHALSMHDAVRFALDNYPSIVAAQSDQQVAAFDIKRAKAKHYPTVDIAGSRRLAGSTDNQFGPRIRLNLYASGAIEAEVERESWRERSLGSTVRDVREGIASDVVTAYLRLFGAIQVRAVAARNLERHRLLVADFQAIAKIDTGRRFDLVQSRARLEQVRFQLAERNTDIALAREVLARYYPQPFDHHALHEPSALPDPIPASASQETELAKQHPAVAAAELDLLSAQANARVAKGNRGLRLDVETRAGANSSSQLVMSWPAFDLAANATADAAAASLIGARANVQEQQRLVLEQQRSARQAWRASSQRRNIALGQIDLAKELVEVYREQFGIGRRNLLDLLNAYTELTNAEAAAQGSLIDGLLARYQIEHAAGKLAALFIQKTP